MEKREVWSVEAITRDESGNVVGDPLAGNYVRVKNLNVVLWDKGIYYYFEARL